MKENMTWHVNMSVIFLTEDWLVSYFYRNTNPKREKWDIIMQQLTLVIKYAGFSILWYVHGDGLTAECLLVPHD